MITITLAQLMDWTTFAGCSLALTAISVFYLLIIFLILSGIILILCGIVSGIAKLCGVKLE